MKRVIITICSIAILALGLFLIYTCLNPKAKDLFDDIINNNSDKNVEEYKKDDYFSSYLFSDIDYDEYSSINENVKISIWNNVLNINDVEIESISYLFGEYAIYDNTLLVMIYRNDKFENRIMEYNLNTGEFAFISELNDARVFISDYISFDKAGVSIVSTYISNGFLKVGKKKENICDLKKYKGYVAFENIVNYNKASYLLDTSEVVRELTLDDYKLANDICK